MKKLPQIFMPCATLLSLIFCLHLSVFAAPTDATPEVVSLDELKQKAVALDQKVVKLKFHYRGDIHQVDVETYYTHLNDKNGDFILVEFPKEAFNAFNKLPIWNKYSSTRPQYVYGKVNRLTETSKRTYVFPGTTILEALGRTISKKMNSENTYAW